MARPTDKDRVTRWQKRVDIANKVHEEWEKKYRCKDLAEYYYGHQYKPEEAEGKYTVNEIFPSIEIQLPSQLFYHPRVIVKARENKVDDLGSTADARAQLQEDTLNTFITNRRLGFKEQTFLALLESYFRFGVIEVGYTADWSDNPNAGKPVLKENSEEAMTDGSGNQVLQPEQNLKYESLYFKQIPADQFRVGVEGRNLLHQCDWCGYFEWHYPEDLKRNKRYKNTSNIKSSGKLRDSGPEETDPHRDMVKVWKIFDLRAKMRFDFAESNDKFLLEEEMDLRNDGSPVVPFAILKKHERLKEFYPLPPVFNWISIQDWLNQQRNLYIKVLRKLVPKFIADNQVEDTEIEKFLENEIVVIKANKPDAITAVNMPTADAGALRNSPVTKEDFREVSGTSGEQKGIADADTATQANIINFESRIRENKARDQVADWLSTICELALFYLGKRMVGPFWVRTNVDLKSPTAALDAANVEKTWMEIRGQDIDGMDSDVTVDVESLSPVNEQGERADWINALALVADPMKGPIILSNEILLRKTLGYFHIKNEKDIQALKQFGTMALRMAMMAAQQQQAAKGGGQQIPSNPEIQSQIESQMEPPQVA